MKPTKIKKQKYYNVMVMTDHHSVRTFRFKSSRISLVIWIVVLFIIAGAAVSATAVHYYKRFYQLQEGHAVIKEELITARLQLEQFCNLTTIASASNQPFPVAYNNEVVPSSEDSNTVADGSSVAGNSTEAGTSAQNPLSNNATASTQEKNGKTGAGGEPAGGTAPEEDVAHTLPLISSEDSPVRINNLAMRASGTNRIRIRYEINAVADERIAGTVAYTCHTATTSGELSTSLEESTFAISRGKVMESTHRLPQGMSTRQIQHIEITVNLEDGRRFSEQFPFPQPASG